VTGATRGRPASAARRRRRFPSGCDARRLSHPLWVV